MKTFLITLLILTFITPVLSQWGEPREIEFALHRIENAISYKNPTSIEDLLSSGITMRIEDSLYQWISCIQARDLLIKYFSDKDSIDFRFTIPFSGTLYYHFNGKHCSTRVDVRLMDLQDDVIISAINISNYPINTAFYNVRRKKDK